MYLSLSLSLFLSLSPCEVVGCGEGGLLRLRRLDWFLCSFVRFFVIGRADIHVTQRREKREKIVERTPRSDNSGNTTKNMTLTAQLTTMRISVLFVSLQALLVLLQLGTTHGFSVNAAGPSARLTTALHDAAPGTTGVKLAQDTIQSLFVDEKCYSTKDGAASFGDSCAFDVVYEDCFEPQPIVGKTVRYAIDFCRVLF